MMIMFTNTDSAHQQVIVRAIGEAIQHLPALEGDEAEDLLLRVETGFGVWTSMGEDEEEDADYHMIIDLDGGVEAFVPKVFHEVKHLEQMVEGRLAWPADGVIMWENVERDANAISWILNINAYMELPWEAEAFDFELLANPLLTSWRQTGEYGLQSKEAS